LCGTTSVYPRVYIGKQFVSLAVDKHCYPVHLCGTQATPYVSSSMKAINIFGGSIVIAIILS